MSTEIDWSKAPEDATHAGTSKGGYSAFYRNISGVWSIYQLGCIWAALKGGCPPEDLSFTPRPAEPLTFGELPRVEQIALFEHVLNGGAVEYFNDEGEWEEKELRRAHVGFFRCDKYRVAPSELQIARAERDILYKQAAELDERIAELQGGAW